MNTGELQAAKDLLHSLVDKILPELISAEEARLGAYGAIAAPIVSAILPVVQQKLDAEIDVLLAAAAPAQA